MSIIGFPSQQTHEPHPRFNLFHLDSNETHLDSMSVHIFNPSLKVLEPGLLHVCSRSLLFDSSSMDTDLLKLQFTNLNFDSFSGDLL